MEIIESTQRKVRINISELNPNGTYKKGKSKGITLVGTKDDTVDFVYKNILNLLKIIRK